MTAHEQLVAARNLLARSRWVQGKLWDSADAEGVRGYCAEGVVLKAGLDVKCGSHWAMKALDHVVGAPPAVFNDAPSRTKDEVLAAFDKAIAATAPPPSGPGPVEAPETEVVA